MCDRFLKCLTIYSQFHFVMSFIQHTKGTSQVCRCLWSSTSVSFSFEIVLCQSFFFVFCMLTHVIASPAVLPKIDYLFVCLDSHLFSYYLNFASNSNSTTEIVALKLSLIANNMWSPHVILFISFRQR
jgi:hypothetical protein